MTRAVTVRCATVEETEAVAALVAGVCRPGSVVVLTGPLGAGKTTFARAYARALGVTRPVTSPSFTLVHHYRCAAGAPVEVLLHADLWRIADASELGDLALDEPLEQGASAIVEWGERFDAAEGLDHVVVTMRVADDEARELTIDLSASAGPDDALSGLAA